MQAEEGTGLLVSLDPGRAGRAASKEAVAAQWFSQDLFQDVEVANATEEPTMPAGKRTKLSAAADAKVPLSGDRLAEPQLDLLNYC